MPSVRAFNAYLLSQQDWVKTLHAASVALGAVAAAGSIAKWVPGPVGLYAGLVVAGTSALRIYVDNVEADLETPVKPVAP